MRYLLFLFIAISFLIWACDSPKSEVEKTSNDTVETVQKEDSVIVQEVNDYIKYVEQFYHQRQKEVNVGPVERNEKVVWLDNEDEDLLRVMYAIYRVDTFFRHTYYLKDSALIYYRYQNWLRTTTPKSASEFICLMDDGKVVKTAKKYLEIEGDERPRELAKLPHIEVKVNHDSMLQIVNNNWLVVMEKKAKGGEVKSSNLFPMAN